MMKKNKEKKRNVKKTVLIILLCLLLFILLVGAAGVITVNHYLNKINRVNEVVDVIPPENEFFEIDESPDENLEVVDPESIVWEETPGVAFNDEDLINILLVGQDRRPGQGRQRSDSMILCSYNPKTNELAMISFLRDLYVRIPGGYKDNRLNATYVFGGFPLLKKTLYANFGITVDGCVEVDFDGFRTLIDLIGGVDINLTAAEAKIIGDGAKEGVSHLDGDHALMYARIRRIDSDFNRTRRQRNVIEAAITKIKDCSFDEIMSLVNTALGLVTTDMTNAQITSLALQYISGLANLEIETYSVPPKGTYRSAMIRGMAVLVPNCSEIRRILKEEYLPF